MKWQPRTSNFYGMAVFPAYLGQTWIEGELMCNDYGQFRRRGWVLHSKAGKMVRVRLDIPDTFFTIPATTEKEHGYVISKNGEFVFMPHNPQRVCPKDFRKELRRSS